MTSNRATGVAEPDEIGHQQLTLSAPWWACQNRLKLHWARWGREPPGFKPSIVLLHEGLGSIRQWRDTPSALNQATGLNVIAFDRFGYGASSARPGPWPVQFMHEEADFVLPALLNALSIRTCILLGHSDGASIALLAAGQLRPLALISIAAHVLVENSCTQSIRQLLNAERRPQLTSALSRYHHASEALLTNWSTVWLSRAFSTWHICDRLLAIQCPVLAIQANDDAYGSMLHMDLIEQSIKQSTGLRLSGGGHSPHLDASSGLLQEIAAFIHQVVIQQAPS
mgnify:CR=1 FL=1